MDKGKLVWDIATVMRMHRILVNRQADESGVYMGQNHVMAYIARHPGCSQSDIATALEQSAAAISLATKRLQERGLIEKRNGEGSLRVNRLYITELGEKNGEKFRSAVEHYNDVAWDGFSEQEIEQMDAYVRRMLGNLKGCLTPEDAESLRK